MDKHYEVEMLAIVYGHHWVEYFYKKWYNKLLAHSAEQKHYIINRYMKKQNYDYNKH